jgi:hypothetical protein
MLCQRMTAVQRTREDATEGFIAGIGDWHVATTKLGESLFA